MTVYSFFSPKHAADFFVFSLSLPFAVPSQIDVYLPKNRRAFVLVMPVDRVESSWHEESVNGKWGFGYTSGWNGSYHDCHHCPAVFAWAYGSGKFKLARRTLREARARYEAGTGVDTCVARFRARDLVRQGD
jgi:hypothetical protein